LSNRISQQQLESYLWGAATLLRGTIDAGDYKQFIFPLLFFKRLCDVFDEETRTALEESGGDKDFALFPENHRFQIPIDAHWRAVRKVSTNVGKALQGAMRAIEKVNPDKLFGIFGDAQWTNRERLSDAMLRDLIEHFSTLDLTVANLPEDELGNGYEYLIKKFADDSGHTAAEFYTNRTVVHLMTELLEPQPGESIYDPTCGSGGMLLSSVAHLRNQKKEWRNLQLFGQERNLMTSSIARMNCFLHGIEDFQIARGDTLSEPKLVEGDRLMQFDVVLANPPYSIKQWDRDTFGADPWGRNLYGTPPQGRADYAFWQHIIASMKEETGRCAILFPHGVLFRQEEAEMRRKLIEADVLEAVIGLGPNLFYNSPMEACVVICRTAKPKERKNKILFINAVDAVKRERGQSLLTEQHIARIVKAYQAFENEVGFARAVSVKEIWQHGGKLSIPLYLTTQLVTAADGFKVFLVVETLNALVTSRNNMVNALKEILPDLPVPSIPDAIYSEDALSLLEERSSWRRVRFGDVVENVNETTHNAAESGIHRFIGLEYLEPGSLHIRSWGNVADGTTFTRICQPGQVLFGKRRAYQRKVALAEFEAVVSGDIYVLTPKDDRLAPELLPFLCLSERFIQYAVETSAGSLSPRTNWDHLAKFEFDLPPLDQQQYISRILWSAYMLEKQLLQLDRSVENAYNAYVAGFFFRNTTSTETQISNTLWDVFKLQELVSDEAPIGYGIVQVGSDHPNGIPTVCIKNLRGDFTGQMHKTAPNIEEKYKRSRVYENDLLISIKATVGEVAVVPRGFSGNISRDIARIRCKGDIDSRILLHLFRSKPYRRYIEKHIVGSTRQELSIHAIKKLEVPLPDQISGRNFLKQVNIMERSSSSIRSHLAMLQHFRHAITARAT
jgi:type I restriction enzyme M protein